MTYADAEPFPHAVIDEWLDPGWVKWRAVLDEFPAADSGAWHRFTGPLEDGKLEADATTAGENVAAIHGILRSDMFMGWLRDLTGQDDLGPDPERIGGGIHGMCAGARLAMHRDFTVHPTESLFPWVRRVNAIVFLNDGWRDEWGGALRLEGNDGDGIDVYPAPGRLVVFESGESGWHGVPEPLRCPPGVMRCSIPAYYYSPPRPGEVVEARSTQFR